MHVCLNELQEAVDAAVRAKPAAEFEAADIEEAFFGKYTEGQLEEALQNLCKHGPPTAAGERIIITSASSFAATSARIRWAGFAAAPTTRTHRTCTSRHVLTGRCVR